MAHGPIKSRPQAPLSHGYLDGFLACHMIWRHDFSFPLLGILETLISHFMLQFLKMNLGVS